MNEPFPSETLVQDPAEFGGRPGERAGGSLGLSEKVQSLRIPEGGSREGSGSSKLAWLLCLVLACSTAYFGWRVYATPPGHSLNESNPASAPQSPQQVAQADSARNGVVLDSKG